MQKIMFLQSICLMRIVNQSTLMVAMKMPVFMRFLLVCQVCPIQGVVIMELKNGCRVEHVLRCSVWIAVDFFRPKAVTDAATDLADGSDYAYGEGCSCYSEQDSSDHSDSSD